MLLVDFIALLKKNNIVQNKLIEALEELESMIGMDNIKEDIVLLVKNLLLGKQNSERYLHTMLLGPPGMGKTVLGNILAKIYASLNLLKPPDSLPDVGEKEEEKFTRERKILIAKRRIEQHINTNNLIRDMEKFSTKLNRARNVETLGFVERLKNLKRSIEDIDNTVNKQITKTCVSYKVCSRADLIAGYTGQSAIKTRKLLNSIIPGVLFIDEAYSLLNHEDDSYGHEVLAVLIEYMSRYKDSLAIIFGGYQKDMEEGILKYQEGLRSRIGYTYILKPHTSSELASIFSIQLKKGHWLLDLERTQLVELLSKYKKYITNGRDTENLLTKCSDYNTDAVFEDILSGKEIKHIITKDIIISSLEHIKKNVPEKEKTLDIYL